MTFTLSPLLRYSAPADPAVTAAAVRLGGVMLAATHAVDPSELVTVYQALRVLADPRTLVGWTVFDVPDSA